MKKNCVAMMAVCCGLSCFAGSINSSPSAPFPMEVIPSGSNMAAPIRIDYSPLDEGDVMVKLDGNILLSSLTTGTFSWQPQSLGSHTLVHVAGANILSVTFNVTELDYFVQPAANPLMPKDSNITITPTTRDIEVGGNGGRFAVSGNAGRWLRARLRHGLFG